MQSPNLDAMRDEFKSGTRHVPENDPVARSVPMWTPIGLI